jgi:hypothetical protein
MHEQAAEISLSLVELATARGVDTRMKPATFPKHRLPLRRSALFLAWMVPAIALFVFSLVHPTLAGRWAEPSVTQRTGLVRELGLTDLALFTEARYTRHPSQADLHSAFQDHPAALDHFPTGSLVPGTLSGAARP